MGKISSALFTIISIFVLSIGIGILTGNIGDWVIPFSQTTTSIDLEVTEYFIFEGINHQRASRKLSELGNDTDLMTISNQWSDELAAKNDLAHGNFEGRMQSIGLPDAEFSCGEIIGYYRSGTVNGVPETDTELELAHEFINMWLNSPPHREIMLTDSGGYMGVGLSCNGSDFYGVVDFKFK